MQMIKTFIALLSVTGVAFAAETTSVFDLKQNVVAGDGSGYLYTFDSSACFGTFEDDADVSGNLFYWTVRSKAQTNVTFTLDLTDVMTAADESSFTTPVKLIGFNLNTTPIGLYLTTSGIKFGSGSEQETTLQNATLSYMDLQENRYSFEGTSGHTCITLTFAQYLNGVKILDNTPPNTSTGPSPALAESSVNDPSNSRLDSILVNTKYIEGVQFYNAWPTNGNFSDVNGGFDLAMKGKLCPEPATAMLSLLCLAGLSARRRK